MKVLSLFDGISACHLALTKAGFNVDTYYTAEIDKYATQISEHHYPDAIRFGDVTKWQEWDIDWSSIDIVTGGFPCQAWSVAGKQLGDKDERGMLFWTMLDIMKMVLKHNPKAYFLMENVKMKREFEEYITHHTEQALGQVEKHLINSALVSAQNRNRYYWSNIQGITQPEDKGLVLADVIEGNGVERPCEPREFKPDSLLHHAADATDIKGHGYNKRVYAETGKCPTLAASSGGNLEPKVLIPLKNVINNPRVKGITENERGFRPHKGDKSKSGLSEYGRILKKTANKTDTLTSNHMPKVLVGRMVGRKINPETGKRDNYNPDLKTEQRIEPRLDQKCGTLTTVQKDNLLIQQSSYRKLTPLECERLQTFPDDWTLVTDENGKQLVSNTQRYKSLGNAWTVDVIAHIFRGINNAK